MTFLELYMYIWWYSNNGNFRPLELDKKMEKKIKKLKSYTIHAFDL